MIEQTYFEKVQQYFFEDKQKAWDWFKAKNKEFGMFSALDMIKLGKAKKVKQYIEKEFGK